MAAVLAYLKEFNFLSAVVRLILAMACGSVVGFGRSKKKQNAGLRTSVLTSIGAAMSVLLACYEYEMMTGQWAAAVAEIGMKFDASRYSAQVISGIGFLAAGTILSSDISRSPVLPPRRAFSPPPAWVWPQVPECTTA